MSYHQMNHCGYCGTPGHNRSTCPERKAYIEKLRKEHGDDHHTVRMYDLRAKRRSANRSIENKQCSFCRERGHTRAGCEEFKGYKFKLGEELTLFKKAFVILLNHYGAGPGAVVKVQFNNPGLRGQVDGGVNFAFSEKEACTMLVTDINLESDFLMLQNSRADRYDQKSGFFQGIMLDSPKQEDIHPGNAYNRYGWDSFKETGLNFLYNFLPATLYTSGLHLDGNNEDGSEDQSCDLSALFDCKYSNVSPGAVISRGLEINPPKKWYTKNRNVLAAILKSTTRYHRQESIIDNLSKIALEEIILRHEYGTLEEAYPTCQKS